MTGSLILFDLQLEILDGIRAPQRDASRNAQKRIVAERSALCVLNALRFFAAHNSVFEIRIFAVRAVGSNISAEQLVFHLNHLCNY